MSATHPPQPDDAPRGVARWSGRALSSYIRLVWWSSRIVEDPPGSIARYAQTSPHITALWHGQFVLVPAAAPPSDTPTAIMVARHGDAEVLGATMQAFGMTLIRGAGAGERRKDRGGTAALRAAMKALRAGQTVAMTADVPPGPARRAGPGITTLAKLSQRPIVPVAVASNRFIALDTWSRLTLNLPFSRIGVSVGDPITVPRDATPEQLELVRRRVEHAMAEVTERAYRAVGRSHYQAMPAAAMPPEAPPLPLGFRLRAYRALTNIGEPAAPLIIRYRERRGKEPSDRKRERFGYASHTRPDGPLIWFHAASVGETNAILPVLEAVRRNRPDHVMLLTTGTLTSAAIAAERLPTGTIHQFLPLDTRRAVKRFIGYWSPTLAVFTESEIWPNMIVALGAARVPIILANARMSARSYKRWRKSRSAARQLFSRFSLVLAQNEPLARRFRQLGARTVRPAGNIKIDAPRLPVDDAALADFKAALGGRPMWLAASTHEGEELVVLDAHAAAATEHTGLITVIVPRHPDRGDDVAQLARTRGLSVAQRSTGALPDITTEIYVADTLGELGLFYRAAPFAFIGGSIADRGGQNPIEAVRESTGILSGPRTYNFSDAYAALKRSEGARTVADADALAAHVIALLGDDVARARLAEGGSAALSKLTGALDATVAAILDHLDDTDDLRRAS